MYLYAEAKIVKNGTKEFEEFIKQYEKDGCIAV